MNIFLTHPRVWIIWTYILLEKHSKTILQLPHWRTFFILHYKMWIMLKWLKYRLYYNKYITIRNRKIRIRILYTQINSYKRTDLSQSVRLLVHLEQHNFIVKKKTNFYVLFTKQHYLSYRKKMRTDLLIYR